MKIINIILPAILFLMVGCGEDSNSNPPANNGALTSLSTVHKDPVLEKVKSANFENLMRETNELSGETYIAYYKRMNLLKFISKPDLKMTFDLPRDENKSKATKGYQKRIYENLWSQKDENSCGHGGTVSKEVILFPRGHLEADTYKANDNTEYEYRACNLGDAIYNGDITYHVVDVTGSESLFGATPTGTFSSNFNHLSIETASQKVTLNGTIKYVAKSQRTPEPNSELTSFEKKYYTDGPFVVEVYNKSTGETVKLIYNGTLDKILYQRGESASSIASNIDMGVFGKFTYRRTSDYTLNVEQNGKIFTIRNQGNSSGLLDNNGVLQPPRPIGYNISNASSMSVSDHTIQNVFLADGTSKYILDTNSDWYPDASSVVGTPTHTLPQSDVDLMSGIVVIGFDTCPPTNRLRRRLERQGIEYSYINMQESAESRALFKWFHISGVPYVGVNGSFFGSVFYNSDTFAVYLNYLGNTIDSTLLQNSYKNLSIRNATVYFREEFSEQPTKTKHTAMAVANDNLTTYMRYRVWSRSSVQKAKEDALAKCEERRKGRKAKGRKEILSQCRLYSVDGVVQENSIVRELGSAN